MEPAAALASNMNSLRSTRVENAITSETAAMSISAVGRPYAMVAVIAQSVTGMISARNGSWAHNTETIMATTHKHSNRIKSVVCEMIR